MNYSLLPLLTLFAFFGPVTQAQAVCPVCTVAVAGGLGVSRWIGIDDAITGVWVGGLILSSGFWLADFISKRQWRIPSPTLFSIALFYLLVIPPLYWADFIGLPENQLWGFDKVVVGTALGSIAFLTGMAIDKGLRAINDGRVFVYFQKVIMPVFMLTVLSYGLYLVTL